jgi:iron complex transport system permease protein
MTARRVTLRAAGFSTRLDLRVLSALALALLATLAAVTVHLGRGDFPIAPLDVLSALVGAGDETTTFIVQDLRLPRALTAVLAGYALGVAGAIFQDVARNPLVAPDVIGVSSGGSFAAVSLIVFTNVGGTAAVPLAALFGSIAAGVALYALAWRDGVHGYRLVLIGIGLAAMLQAGISYVLARGQIFDVTQAYVWLVGSLNGRGWEHVWPLVITLAVLLPIALAFGRHLETLQLGDEVARTLGASVERTRLGLLAIGVVLTGVAVAATGPIAFVAFIAPHIARRLAGSVAPSAIVPLAGAIGSLIIVAADLAGRTAFASHEIPVGIVTSIIAAPYFLFLLYRAGRMGATG